ncbi:MAG TPA: hypothetical protein DET40_18620 [Lentisphaeria bacterium]|nr:MAG: hypothetical protein A2X45_10890 [Lentisphaerae bacterium GWF2_50_93]HCE45559.1 hypothetical protein [Lentisphaeria bacterium]
MRKRSFIPIVADKRTKTLPAEFPVNIERNRYQTDAPIKTIHVHDCLEIGFCHEGNGIFICGDRILPYSKGDVTVFNEVSAHFASSASGTKSNWSFIFFEPSVFLSDTCGKTDVLSTSRLCGRSFPYVFSKRKYPLISELFEKLLEEMDGRKKNYQTAFKALMIRFLIEVDRSSGDRTTGTSIQNIKISQNAIERISPALNYLGHHYHEQITVTDIAKRTYVSVETLRRLFHKAVRKSPEKYLHDLRISMAANLLENTSDAVIDIAGRVGYTSLSSFNRQFKSKKGVSPREWRKKGKF